MDFESAERHLDTLLSYERERNFIYDENNFDLDRFRKVVKEKGVDYSKLKFVHVAGSKGKGSVCNLISEYLVRDGFDVGLFTSPHLRDLRERIKVNGEMISKDDFAKYVNWAKGSEITYFEMLTLIALKYFVDRGVEYVAFEVGLGGRLDSTNIVTPELSVLTSVEMEHVGILGENLSEILDEKLGIVKNEVPLLVGDQSEEVMGLLKEKLKRKVDVYFISGGKNAWEKNLKLACNAISMILNVDVKCTKNVNIGDFQVEGRFDVREIEGKTVVFDVAHTVNSIKNLIDSLKEKFSDKEFVFLVAFKEDKDVDAMMKELESYSVKKISLEDDIEGNYREILLDLKRDQILVVTGSHYLVGKIIPS